MNLIDRLLIDEYWVGRTKAWEIKEWLIKLAIPEHVLGWTFLVCPIAGLIVAGLGILLG